MNEELQKYIKSQEEMFDILQELCESLRRNTIKYAETGNVMYLDCIKMNQSTAERVIKYFANVPWYIDMHRE